MFASWWGGWTKYDWFGGKVRDSNGNLKTMQCLESHPRVPLRQIARNPYSQHQPARVPYPPVYQNNQQYYSNGNGGKFSRKQPMSTSMDQSQLHQSLAYYPSAIGYNEAYRIPQKLNTANQMSNEQASSSTGNNASRIPTGSNRRPGGNPQQQRRPPSQQQRQQQQQHQRQLTSSSSPSVLPTRTQFGRLLKENTMAVPPSLLKSPPAASTTSSQTAGGVKEAKLKVVARVSGDSRDGVITADGRKRQVVLMESPTSPNATGGPQPRPFTFDAVFEPQDSLQEISSSCLPEVLQAIMNGSDACLLSFGHANAAKDRLVSGGGEPGSGGELGVFPTAIGWLYRLIDEYRRRRPDCRYSVRVSALEVAGAAASAQTLNDLLVAMQNGDTADERVGCVSVSDDPVFGTQLRNVTELRAPTASDAASCLDVALTNRRTETSEQRRNSHLFFTLHVYQYTVNSGKTGVAGGRCRLHLIDLGSCEKTSKAGRDTLTFPALGNVLVTLLQGQKYLPFKDNLVTRLLKEAVGASTCRSTSVLACLDVERVNDASNVLQIAAKIQRIKRHRKKMGVSSSGLIGGGGGGGSDSGSSSAVTAIAARRRRLANSDPEAASSSEQSCAETVIFLGGGLRGLRPARVNAGGDDGETTDADGAGGSQVGRLAAAAMPATNPNVRNSPARATSSSENRMVDRKEVLLGGTPTKRTNAMVARPSNETWIDGPQAAMWVDGPLADPGPSNIQPQRLTAIQDEQTGLFRMTSGDAAPTKTKEKREKRLHSSDSMDPLKREMIQRWVLHQEQQRASETIVPSDEKQENLDSTPVDISSPADPMSLTDDQSSSSIAIVATETRDASVQADELDIDVTLVEQQRDVEDAADITAIFAQFAAPQASFDQTDTEIRYLEEIPEADEDNLSQSAASSSYRGSHAITSEPPKDRCWGEAMALVGVPALDLGPLAALTQQHPLRILSEEGGINRETARSDTFSLNSERFDEESLPGTDQLNDEDEELLNEDDLERAMAASMSSVRSLDLLQKLRDDAAEAERQRCERDSWFDYNGNDGAALRNEPLRARLAEPEGSESSSSDPLMKRALELTAYSERRAMKKDVPSGAIRKTVSKAKAAGLVCCSSMISSESSGHSYKQQNALALAKVPGESSITVTQSQLSLLEKNPDGICRPTIPELPLAVSREITSTLSKSGLPVKASTSRRSSATSSKGSIGPLAGSLQRPEKLMESSAATSTSLPRRGWRTSSTNSDRSSKKKQPPAALPRKSVASSSPTKSPSSVSSVSGLISFIRSPSHHAGHKATPTTATAAVADAKKRASSGYESGGGADSSCPPKSPAKRPNAGVRSVSMGGGGPPPAVSSPYAKVTNPKRSPRTSSGNGSDSSGANNPTAGVGLKPQSRLAALFAGRNKPRQRESLSASSGYESGGVKEPMTPTAKMSQTATTVIPLTTGSLSAPETPSRPSTFEAIDRQARDNMEVLAIKEKQDRLKRELETAKRNLGIPASKWDYGLHALECMKLTDSGLLEALRQETKILEKRVIACRNHSMVVTAFV